MSKELDKKLILNKIKDRFKFVSDTQFATYLGIKPQTLSSWYSRNTFDIELLYAKCVNINPNFLFTGKGEVLLDDINVNIEDEGTKIFKLKSDKVYESQAVPLYNIEASAGIVTLFRDSKNIEPVDHITIPNLPKCDGAIYVNGDSMYPLLKSGDIVMYRQHDMSDGILWGEMYLINYEHGGDDITAVKYIKKSEEGNEFIKLVSQNQHHQDRDILLKKVRALALVKASIRINSMT